jgi:hypothetical protein
LQNASPQNAQKLCTGNLINLMEAEAAFDDVMPENSIAGNPLPVS